MSQNFFEQVGHLWSLVNVRSIREEACDVSQTCLIIFRHLSRPHMAGQSSLQSDVTEPSSLIKNQALTRTGINPVQPCTSYQKY